MSSGRMLALLLLAGVALATSALFAARLPHALTVAEVPATRPSPEPANRVPHRHRESRPQTTPPRPAPKPHARRSELGPRVLGLSLPLLIALEAAGGTLGLATSAVALGVHRARARRRRDYARYVLHLSPHDE